MSKQEENTTGYGKRWYVVEDMCCACENNKDTRWKPKSCDVIIVSSSYLSSWNAPGPTVFLSSRLHLLCPRTPVLFPLRPSGDTPHRLGAYCGAGWWRLLPRHPDCRLSPLRWRCRNLHSAAPPAAAPGSCRPFLWWWRRSPGPECHS